MNLYRQVVSDYIWSTAVLAVLVVFGGTARAGGSPGLTAQMAGVHNSLRLCKQEINGKSETFACRELNDAGNRYLLLFKGGPAPRVVVLQRRVAGVSRVRQAEQVATATRATWEAPPAGVPPEAVHRGTGVCANDLNHLVPCSFYEQAAEWPTQRVRYRVAFDPDGAGPTRIDVVNNKGSANVLFVDSRSQQ